ncbi:MAG: monofunctional biosynthetic peptidoglycan transglycosylase [Nitrospina sp.]|nr:monofunctional biosynthetic peptidoglycan transglycosylase [Nitrospina sp.]MBT6601481.1 monofunctional biosynthetic peptidoglycan transglycosylase [Nitrospina sp.]
MPRAKKKSKKKNIKTSIKVNFFKIFFDFLIIFLIFTVIPVLVYRLVDPPTTPLLWIRWIESDYEKSRPTFLKHWVPLKKISPNLIRAVIAAEDQKFFHHSGFDWKAVEAAIKTNFFTDKMVGASTISMQTARNVFLWQNRSWLRKSLEAWFTFLIENLWSKERILEVYLNVIEWGDGIFGCQYASFKYYKHSSATLSPVESALMASILPSPRAWSVLKPQQHVIDRQIKILSAMNKN